MEIPNVVKKAKTSKFNFFITTNDAAVLKNFIEKVCINCVILLQLFIA